MSFLINQSAEHLLKILADENNGDFDRVHEPDALEHLRANVEIGEPVHDVVDLVNQLYEAVESYERAQHNDGRTGPDESDADKMHEALDLIRGEARELLAEFFPASALPLPVVTIEHTGGNCTAYKMKWGNRHILITAECDPSLPADNDAQAIMVGLYNEETQEPIGDAVMVGLCGPHDAPMDDNALVCGNCGGPERHENGLCSNCGIW